MTYDSISIECVLSSPVPVVVTYVLDGLTVQRLVGPKLASPITIDIDTGSSVTLYAPKSAQTGSISNSPPDLKTYRFVSWLKTSGTVQYVQSYTESPTDGDIFTLTYEETTVHTTKSASRRASKLYAKTDPEVAQIRATALGPLQIKNQAIIAYEQTALETKLGTVLCNLGIIGNDQHHYRNFAQQLYGLRRTFTQLTLQNEASLAGLKWMARGMIPDVLVKTAQLQGIDLNLGELKITFTSSSEDGQVTISNPDGTSTNFALIGAPQDVFVPAGKPVQIKGQCAGVPSYISFQKNSTLLGYILCEETETDADFQAFPGGENTLTFNEAESIDVESGSV